MKVIKSGSQPWSKECECHNCKAVLQIEYQDLYKRDSWDTEIYDIYFSCPECLEETIINFDGPNRKDIPIRTTKIFNSNKIINVFSSFFK